MIRTRTIAYLATVFMLLFSDFASAQLPSGSNVNEAWYQGTLDGIRIFYGYRSNAEDFHCRIDYGYDGRIVLFVDEVFYRNSDSPIRSIATFYLLKPYVERPLYGKQLVRISYKTDQNLNVEPIISQEDPFTKRCVPLLNDLFRQIPAPEVKMFRDQYGSVFSIK